jgi:aldose 1-epimerase
MSSVITLKSANATVTVAPELGGRIAELWMGESQMLIAATDGPAATHPMRWGSFPTAPWTGRVRHGRFQLAGATHQLELPLPPHAIHGTVYRRPWRVDSQTEQSVSLSCDLDWEFGGTASQRITVDDVVYSELAVRAGDRAMPAELGWHPWFAKPEALTFTPDAMYARDGEGIPSGQLVAPTTGPWDDCFINTDPVALHYRDLTMTVVSDCDHWAIYDEPVHTTCVEPLSGPPDAFTIRPRVLAPGETLQRWCRISWTS